ncbi:MAG: hypothetical protein ATN32_00940 [Candidatus Epulonipiscium fishelsonii]|nr:MAG: hypothetical protein ATN32_00940 [Epulopiscium sp. AS2M-Bin002]
MRYILKKLLPYKIQLLLIQHIKNNLIILKGINYTKMYILGFLKIKNLRNLSKKKKIFLIDTPIHGNLGDQAIAEAEIKLLTKILPNYQIIELSHKDILENLLSLKKYINRNDIIILHGGGNFGIEYFSYELIRREVITKLKHNLIILFPQTIDFGKTKKGKIELKKSVQIYKHHTNLILLAREKFSYKTMKKHFFNEIILIPDVVLTLDKSKDKCNRSGVLLCLRNDRESILNEEKKILLIKLCKKFFDKVIITDTAVNKIIYKSIREDELNYKWKQFQTAKLIITDRIHGMIFAAITGTPCIALDNYNYKVKGTYECIKNLDYIKYVDNINQVENILSSMNLEKEYTYHNQNLINKYKQVTRHILNEGKIYNEK